MERGLDGQEDFGDFNEFANRVNLVGKEQKLKEAIFMQIKSILDTQKTLVEAAGASQYGWNAAKHMEDKKGFFSANDKDNLAKLRVAEGYVL